MGRSIFVGSFCIGKTDVLVFLDAEGRAGTGDQGSKAALILLRILHSGTRFYFLSLGCGVVALGDVRLKGAPTVLGLVYRISVGIYLWDDDGT